MSTAISGEQDGLEGGALLSLSCKGTGGLCRDVGVCIIHGWWGTKEMCRVLASPRLGLRWISKIQLALFGESCMV